METAPYPKTYILIHSEGKTPVITAKNRNDATLFKKEGTSYGCFVLFNERINLAVALPSFLKRVARSDLSLCDGCFAFGRVSDFRKVRFQGKDGTTNFFPS